MEKYRGIFEGYYLAIQISGMLLCSVFGSLFCGIWLDRTLGTRPWLMFVLMIVGIVFATYAIYRTVKEPPK